MLRFLLYLGRWQLSTPVLWLVVSNLGAGLEATVLANLIGGSIFFWVDRFIFRGAGIALWETVRDGACNDCGSVTSVTRLVLAPGAKAASPYDRREDSQPQYRCAACSRRKLESLKRLRAVAEGVAAA